MAEKKNEESVKEVWDKLPEEEKEKISKELEEAASNVEPYSMDDLCKALDNALDGFSKRMDQLCKEFADIFCGEEQEEEKMEPTSKQVINGCNFVNIYQDPTDESTRLTLKNDDDTFEIEINGYESYKAFRRLIFNDSNCSKVMKHNQELADEVIALRKENIELMQHKELREAENQHLREDIMRAKDELHSLKLQKKLSFINANSVYGLDPSIPAIRIVKENENLKEEVKRLREKYETEGKPLTTRTDILKMADKCINGQREQDYGTPENNFQLIANIWNAICKTDIFTPELVALCMIGMKSARIVSGGGTGDSWVDICGYAACGGEINARRKQTEKPVSKGE